jgi:hypothetical protein
MPFKYTFQVENDGTTVPYPAFKDAVRDNRGFVDLRGRPDRAMDIAEGAISVALSKLLARSPHVANIFTLGCDLGSSRPMFLSVADRQREVTFRLLVSTFTRLQLTAYAALANGLVAEIRT